MLSGFQWPVVHFMQSHKNVHKVKVSLLCLWHVPSIFPLFCALSFSLTNRVLVDSTPCVQACGTGSGLRGHTEQCHPQMSGRISQQTETWNGETPCRCCFQETEDPGAGHRPLVPCHRPAHAETLSLQSQTAQRNVLSMPRLHSRFQAPSQPKHDVPHTWMHADRLICDGHKGQTRFCSQSSFRGESHSWLCEHVHSSRTLNVT